MSGIPCWFPILKPCKVKFFFQSFVFFLAVKEKHILKSKALANEHCLQHGRFISLNERRRPTAFCGRDSCLHLCSNGFAIIYNNYGSRLQANDQKNKRVTDIGHPRCQGMNKKMCIGLWELCCLNIQQRKLQSTGS